jgi:uncharacterized protein (DUF58 family)
MTERETDRWRGVMALAFAAGAVGIVLSRPAALLVATVGVAYAAYARPSPPPEPDLTVERTVSDDRPDPGDGVEVHLELRNEGDDTLADLRVVDGVPPALEVVDGSPRLATSLRPGKRATVSYTVEAVRGAHEFEPAQVMVRRFSGAIERETTVSDETRVDCVPRLGTVESFPLRKQTVQHVGRVTTDSPGSGVEFHSTREYRPGDPLTRIDWNRRAKTGELTTIEFRKEQAATVVLVVDTREQAYVGDGETSAVEHCVGAAGGIATGLLDSGDRVGASSLGPRWAWVAPGLGRVHRTQLEEALALDPGVSPNPPTERFLAGLALRRLRKHVPSDAQVVYLSPLADDFAPLAARRLEAYGHRVTVVTPDVTGDDTPGGQLAGLERDVRIRTLRRAGVRVLDWDTDRPLPVAVADAARGWQQ